MPGHPIASTDTATLDVPDAAALFRLLLSQTEDLVVVLDPQLRVCLLNAAARSTLGRSGLLEAGVGLSGLSALQPADIEQIERNCRAVLAGAVSAPQRVVMVAGALQGREFRLRVLASRQASVPDHAVMLHASDVTDLAEVEQRLRARELEFRTLAENSPDNIIRYGLDLRAVYCNQEIEERVAVESRRLLGRTPVEGAPPGMVGTEAYQEQLARTLVTGERATVELRVPTPTGDLRIHHVLIAPEHDAQGTICGAIAVGRDVTTLVRALERASAAEREYRTLAENADDNIVRWDGEGRMVYVNPAMARVLGVAAEDLLGSTPHQAYPRGDFDLVQDAVREVHGSGEARLLELSWQPAPGRRVQHHQIRLVPERDASGVVATVLGVGRDITDAVEQRELVASRARQDPLTLLANRMALTERAPGVFAGARRHQGKVGVLLVDLDGFKAINDGLGHSAGDQVLCRLAHRFVDALRADDLLVRLGGDEFVVLAPDVDSTTGVARVAEKLHAALVAPTDVLGREVRLTASIGVALFPDDGIDIEQLLANADSAMYQAKRSGRSRTEFYTASIGAAVRRRLVLEQALREACRGLGMALHYQPQMRVDGGARPVGAEALLRWQHAELGSVSPCEFVSLAEETGLIVELGAWVFEQVALQARAWNLGREEPFRLAVNVSTRQLAEPDFADRVAGALARTGCRPEWLEIEITESVFAAGAGPAEGTLRRLKELGLPIALDDFGTGFSALNYLTRFPVDTLKIDRCFVQAVADGERPRELVRAFLAMARALKLDVVAEGVETAEQCAFMSAAGCPVMQGWHFGRAVAAQDFERLWLAMR
jgi:diguanylate cyclase (GGDEF)-like protein/PAS domain S-box-containing protein